MKIIDFFVKIKDKMQELYKKNKKLFFISLAMIIFVIALFFVPNQLQKQDENKLNQTKNESASYAEMIELKIENMLSYISSIKLSKVMVVVESTPQINYLKQNESTKTTNSSGESIVEKEEIIYEKNGSSQTPVVVSTTYPKISGVLIVLNRIDASTKISIENAISGVLNISADCIFILQDR